MGACATQTFNNVTSSAWTCMTQKMAASYGINVSGNSGEQTKDGFTIKWNYDPNAQTLQLQCTDSPFWAPCSSINGKIHDEVESCL